MKLYDPLSLLDLDPGPWKRDPLTHYWATESGLIGIPSWIGPVVSWNRWANQRVETTQCRKAKFPNHAPNAKGYLRASSTLVHRVVARAWIPNPDNKPQVNHKDGNKQNNQVYNLEWATNGENIKHSYDHLERNQNTNRDHLGRFTHASQ